MEPTRSVPLSTVSETLISMGPGFAVGLFACTGWYLISRYLMRHQDAVWLAALPLVPVALPAGSHDLKIKDAALRVAALHARGYASGRGRPSDRLFVFGLLVAGVTAIAGTAFMLAITFN